MGHPKMLDYTSVLSTTSMEKLTPTLPSTLRWPLSSETDQSSRRRRRSLLSFSAPSRVLKTLTCNGSRKARPSLHPRELGSLLRRRNQKSVMEKLLFSWKFTILRSLTKEATSLLPRVRLEKLNPRLSPCKRSRLRWKLPKPPQNLCLL